MDHGSATPEAGRALRYQQGRALKVSLVLFALLALFVLALPALVSSGPGTQVVTRLANGAIPGELAIDELSLGWFSGQRASGVRIADPEGTEVIRLQQLDTELTLLQALRGELTVGLTRLEGLRAELVVDEDGSLNLDRALGLGGEAQAESGPVMVPATGNVQLEGAHVSWHTPGMPPVALTELNGQARLDPVTRVLDFRLDGVSQLAEERGSLLVRGELRDFLDAQGVLTPSSLRFDGHAELENLPLALVDGIAGLDGLLLAALGDRLTLQLTGTEQQMALNARAPLLKADLAFDLVGEQLELREAGRVDWQFEPALLAQLAGADDTLGLEETVPLALRLERLTLPLAAFNPAAVSLAASLESETPIRLQATDLGPLSVRDFRAVLDTAGLDQALDIELGAQLNSEQGAGGIAVVLALSRLFAADGTLQLDQLRAQGQAEVEDFPVALLDPLAGGDGLLASALGPELDLSARAENSASGELSATVDLRSAQLQTEPFNLHLDEHLQLAEPATLNFRLQPVLLASLAPESGGALAAPARMTLTLDRLRFPVPGDGVSLTPERIELAARLQSEPLRWQDSTGVETRLEALSGTLSGESLAALTLALDGRLSQSAEGVLTRLAAAPLQWQLELASGLTEAFALKQTEATLNAQGGGVQLNAPLRIAGDLSRAELRAPAELKLPMRDALLPAAAELVGAELALTLDGALNLGEAPAGNFTVQARSEHLTTDASLQLSETLSLQRPAELQWRFTPAAHRALQADATQPPLLLQEPTTVSGTIERFSLPLGGTAMPDLAARFQIADSTLRRDGDAERYRLQGWSADLNGDGNSLQTQLRGDIASGQGNAGKVRLSLLASDLFDADGAPALDQLSLDLDSELTAVPVAVLDGLFGFDGLLSASLGEQVNGRISSQLQQGQGPLDARLESPNAKVQLAGAWSDGVMTLREPFTAAIQPTEAFGRVVLARVHPLFETLRGGEAPIQLRIPAEGVQVPLSDFAIEGVSLPEVDLRLGELELANGWLLDGLMRMGQRYGALKTAEGNWRAEFTPAIVALEKGQLSYKKRMDLLLGEQMHLATWGSLDLAQQQANLVLGIMPDTLAAVFGIKVAADDALRIPISGPLGSDAFDLSSVASELLRLQAQRQLGGRSPLLGALAGALSGGKQLGLQGAPQPSVDPLPWAERMQRKAEAAADEAAEPAEPAP